MPPKDWPTTEAFAGFGHSETLDLLRRVCWLGESETRAMDRALRRYVPQEVALGRAKTEAEFYQLLAWMVWLHFGHPPKMDPIYHEELAKEETS